MLWLALHLPLLSLEAFCAGLPAGRTAGAVALVAGHRLTAVNAAAAARGLAAGLERATALALAGDVLLGQADARRDAAALEAVAHAALAFTPMVAFEGEATVLLEVQPSLRCFGGRQSLVERLRATLAPLGHRVHLAAAPTPLGAALLAAWRDGLDSGDHTTQPAALQALLDGAPVWLLGRGQRHWEALQGMGLRTLQDLRVLPRGGLARRFGTELLDDLDRALGRRADPRPAVAPRAEFAARLELYTRADTAEQVLHGARVLLARLVAWAQARQARIAAFTLQMRHEARHRGSAPPETLLRIELAEPSLDAAHLQLLLRERLARTTLAAPTLELGLACHELAHSAPPNGELFPTRASEAVGLTRLLERLRARLGDPHVLRLVAGSDHRPERANVLHPSAQPLPAPAEAPAGAALRHHPAWLLARVQALEERDGLPRYEGGPLGLVAGPERLETGWWDGGLALRDYYVAQARDGGLLWIYCERLPHADGSHWFLQGRFG